LKELTTQSPEFLARLPAIQTEVVTVPIWKERAAEKAGLTAETVITHVEGTQVPNRDDLMMNIRSRKAGIK